MRREIRNTALVLLALLTGRASAEADPAAALEAACARPAWSGELPDAAVATQEEMLSAQRSVKAFDRAVADYGECLAAAEARLAADGGDAEVLRNARIRGNDGAVGEAERLAAEFNALLQDWRERPPAGEFVQAKFIGFTDRRKVSDCYSSELRASGTEMQSSVAVRIDAEGKASPREWPVGASEPFKKTVLCVLALMRFSPATVDGRPVPSRGTLPVSLTITEFADMPTSARFEPPKAISTDEEMRRAQAECAPPGFTGRGEPGVELKVSAVGRVSGIRIVQSSGDPGVDRLAECIIGKMRFAPGKRNGAARHMTMTTTVTIGAPASGPRGDSPPPATGTTPP